MMGDFQGVVAFQGRLLQDGVLGEMPDHAHR